MLGCGADILPPDMIDGGLDPNQGHAQGPDFDAASPNESADAGTYDPPYAPDGDDDTVPGDDEGTGLSDDGDGVSSPEPEPTRPGYTLVWRDEFDGPAGTVPDPSRWRPDIGGHGWGNNQQEFNTDRPENAAHDGNGNLVLTARRESYMGNDYTGARYTTLGTFAQAYGRFEARMKLPSGQGIWPAFWMLGENFGDVGWPTCGEIDIMENIGREPTRVHGTLHGPGYSGENGIGRGYDLPNGQRVDGGFHVYAVEWEENEIRWYVDDVLYQTRTPSDLPQGARWVYDHPFFLIMNIAVGGYWPGYPDGSTQLPQQLVIDYVRVFQRTP